MCVSVLIIVIVMISSPCRLDQPAGNDHGHLSITLLLLFTVVTCVWFISPVWSLPVTQLEYWTCMSECICTMVNSWLTLALISEGEVCSCIFSSFQLEQRVFFLYSSLGLLVHVCTPDVWRFYHAWCQTLRLETLCKQWLVKIMYN